MSMQNQNFCKIHSQGKRSMKELVFTKLPYGLYLISTRLGSEMDACLCNTVVQITHIPKRIVFSLEKNENVHRLLLENKKAVISILSTRTDEAVLEYFSSEAEEKTKFRTDSNSYPYALTVDGIPYLMKHANAYICCQVISSIDLGTHTLFIAECTDGDVLHDDSSFLYYHSELFLEKKSSSQPTDVGMTQ